MNFWRKVFSEPGGDPSAGRIYTAVLVCGAVFWVSYLVVRNHALPDFAGLTIFMGSLYAVNKVWAAKPQEGGSK